jgi:hypothetical protein
LVFQKTPTDDHEAGAPLRPLKRDDNVAAAQPLDKKNLPVKSFAQLMADQLKQKASAAAGVQHPAQTSKAGTAPNIQRDTHSSHPLGQTSDSNLQAVINAMLNLDEALSRPDKESVQDGILSYCSFWHLKSFLLYVLKDQVTGPFLRIFFAKCLRFPNSATSIRALLINRHVL